MSKKPPKAKAGGTHTTRTGETANVDGTSPLQPTQKQPNRAPHTYTSTMQTRVSKEPDLTHQPNKQPWLQIYTQWTFEQMHLQLYPIVENILKSKLNREHPFQTKWRQLQAAGNKYPMTKNSSWRTIKLLLDIEDISQYRDFIGTCPMIEEYVYLKNKSKNQVEFGVLHTKKTENDPMDSNEINPMEILSTQEMVTAHLKKLLTTFVNCLKKYMEEHDDEYSELCQEWFDNGLHQENTMKDIQTICNISSQEDFYMLLKLSPALQEKYEVMKKDNDEIELIPKLQLEEEISIKNQNPEDTDHNFTTLLSNSDWSALHKQVFKPVTAWANTHTKNHLAMAWRSALRDGLTADTTWQEAKQLLLTNTYVEYSCYLTACPLLSNVMKIYVDADDYGVSYSLYETNNTINTVSVQNTPIINNTIQSSRTLNETVANNLSMPTFSDEGTTIISDDNTETNREPDNPSDTSWENVQQILWEPEHPTENFSFVNSMIYKTIQEWASDPTNKKHSFYGTYQHIKYKGYSQTTPWEKICQIFNIHNIGQYIDFVYQCPAIYSEYQLHWDKQPNTIRYRWRQQKDIGDLTKETQVVQSTYAHLKTLT
jgi:hypothetical protein